MKSRANGFFLHNERTFPVLLFYDEISGHYRRLRPGNDRLLGDSKLVPNLLEAPQIKRLTSP
jgi:hypothetical protein